MVARDLLLAEPATTTTPQLVREELRRWLASWSWPEDDLDDVVAAVDEAVSNVVDHAYRSLPSPGEVRVRARVDPEGDGHRVTVVVSDRGRWRPVPADPGHRGRGLLMMRCCAADVRIEPDEHGTRVTLTSAPVPAREPVPRSG
jgi:serine/threonine-protein kinase RsbW